MGVAAILCGCGPLAGIKNPFSKEEPKLPGERIAVITDPGQIAAQQATLKPVSLPPPQANASWSQPGGVASNNLGHLASAAPCARSGPRTLAPAPRRAGD
ncbi:hypothetical protein AUC69_02860 [Methyloceanibacter superfactus]|uniref:Uncharacterized protein n=2 Tax=Methyloceanibacter superfactus TaxID=1774969 RepID=A0A1E3VMM4_9HYPH|nr:hypothetical protein AUC69_02860 [Methyloceanibacter superfactus]